MKSVRTWLFAAAILSTPSFAFAQVPMDEAGFTQYAADTVSAVLNKEKVEVSGLYRITIHLPSLATVAVSVKGDHAACEKTPEQCEQIVKDIAILFVSLQRPFQPPPPEIEKLWASVEPPNAVQLGTPIGQDGDMRPVIAPFVGKLAVHCRADKASATDQLQYRQLKTIHLSADEAISRCIQNTVSSQPDFFATIPLVIKHGSNVVRSPFVTTLMLSVDKWAPLAAKFDGELLVAAPDTGALVYSNGATTEDADMLVLRAQYILHESLPDFEKQIDPDWEKSIKANCCEVYRWAPSGWTVVTH